MRVKIDTDIPPPARYKGDLPDVDWQGLKIRHCATISFDAVDGMSAAKRKVFRNSIVSTAVREIKRKHGRGSVRSRWLEDGSLRVWRMT